MNRCFWCNADPEENAKHHVGPHATWCPHHRREQRRHRLAPPPHPYPEDEQMSERKHTPGKWNADGGSVYSSDATGSIIAQCEAFRFVPRAKAEEEANAALIAAAPDLLSAAKAAAAYMATNIYPQPDKPSPEWQALCDLRAAIAKATSDRG